MGQDHDYSKLEFASRAIEHAWDIVADAIPAVRLKETCFPNIKFCLLLLLLFSPRIPGTVTYK